MTGFVQLDEGFRRVAVPALLARGCFAIANDVEGVDGPVSGVEARIGPVRKGAEALRAGCRLQGGGCRRPAHRALRGFVAGRRVMRGKVRVGQLPGGLRSGIASMGEGGLGTPSAEMQWPRSA